MLAHIRLERGNVNEKKKSNTRSNLERPSSCIQVHDYVLTRWLYDLCGYWVLTGKRSIQDFTDRKGAGWLCVCLTLKKSTVFFFFCYSKRIRISYGIFTTDRTFSDLSPPVVGVYVYRIVHYNTVNRPYNTCLGVLMATAIFNARYDNVAYTFFYDFHSYRRPRIRNLLLISRAPLHERYIPRIRYKKTCTRRFV